MYSEMVLYIEACESGSMFDGILANNLNIYAVTAANPSESSWGTYCYPDDQVNGQHINSCLGDLFSVNWMEDADKQDPKKESLEA
jgi:legumain